MEKVKTLYLLMLVEYDGTSIEGVFDSRTDAIKYFETKYEESFDEGEGWTIESVVYYRRG